MTRILFVDDEPKVLRGLQRLLFELNCEWEAEFAPSARQALELLASTPFDVVVSDMRMPEMDGAALLNEVRQRYPGVVRMVLSGHSDRQLVLRSVSSAHCYLTKPCDPNSLRGAIARAVALCQVLRNPQLRELVSRLNSIPSLPQIYQDIIGVLQADVVSLKAVGEIISRDLGMTAKILQLVNSSFFGIPRHVSDPVDAVRLLGLEIIKALVLTVHIFTELTTAAIADLGLEGLWDHSARTADIARDIAVMQKAEQYVCDYAFLGGLLHDTGKLILAANLPGEYARMLALQSAEELTYEQAESKVFGATHQEVGAYLLGIWGLPDGIVEAVAFHHRPDSLLSEQFSAVTAVHIADAFEYAQRAAQPECALAKLDLNHLNRLQLAERLPIWTEKYLDKATV